MNLPRIRICESRRGAVMVVVALCLIVLMIGGALSIDLGRMHQERTKLQAAADAAADAAGLELFQKYKTDHGLDMNGSARSSAYLLAEANGYEPKNVVVNIPPLSGPNAGKPGYVEVLVNSDLKSTFSSVIGFKYLSTSARAVGVGATVNTKAGLLVLEDKKNKTTLRTKGTRSSLSVLGDIFVNSPGKKSVKVSKKAEIVANHLITAGGIDRKSKGMIDAQVTTGASPTPDPLANLIPIPEKGPKQDVKKLLSTNGSQLTYDLIPGTYSELKFDKQAAVNMAPGVYYVDGGAIDFKETVSLEARGVMIYSNSKKTVNFKSNGTMTLTPPTSGPYKGVSVFLNPSKKSKMQFNKSGSYNITGIVYAPKSEIKFSKSTVEFGEPDDDEDWDAEDPEYDEEDLIDGPSDQDLAEPNSVIDVGMSVIARRVTIGKNSIVRLQGQDINLTRPIKGLVE